MKLKFAPVSNCGQPGELQALYGVSPWIKELIGTRQVSIIRIMSYDELPTHDFTESACGYNVKGRVILRKDQKVVKDVTWDDIHKHRLELGCEPVYLNSPQTEMTGEEDACVILQDHAEDHDTCFKGISLEVFMCSRGATFGDSLAFKGWLLQPSVRKQFKDAGVAV
jgi:hypothetical protein